MKTYIIRIMLASLCLILICSGCSNDQQTKAKISTEKSVLTSSDNHKSKKDGTVISMKKIKVAHTDASLATYRMMYWSHGTKAEAYVAVPKDNRSYRLFVKCHGGYVAPNDMTHVNAIFSTNIMDERMISYAPMRVVTLIPLYRGYGRSDGTINGLKGSTLDTENAIKAVTAYFNQKKDIKKIEEGMIYLRGLSMGGGVVLNVASERKDVVSVIAISPFVGWDIAGTWAEKNKNNPLAASYLQYIKKTDESFNPESPGIQEQSIDYKKITAPVLLLQGTADSSVSWQTVQTLCKKMDANHQNVTFKLIKGGYHVLSNKQSIMNKTISEWFAQH